MRIGLLLLWLVVPIAALFYHFGPGQDKMKVDIAGGHLRDASFQASENQWSAANANFNQALDKLPGDHDAAKRGIRLERAKALLNDSKLAPAYNELTLLVEELEKDESADPKMLREAKASLGNAEYYVTWLLRLEGEPREIWEPEIESARQTFRRLAEEALAEGDAEAAETYSRDLESVIRLARMDLSELEALALPSQCKGCKSGQCNCKCKGKKPSNKAGKKKSKDARGASAGPPPDGGGS